MASYDYQCRTCDSEFTVQRPMTDVATLVRCPSGHEDVARVWSTVSITGRASASAPAFAPSSAPAPASSGGCACGGNCCC